MPEPEISYFQDDNTNEIIIYAKGWVEKGCTKTMDKIIEELMRHTGLPKSMFRVEFTREGKGDAQLEQSQMQQRRQIQYQ